MKKVAKLICCMLSIVIMLSCMPSDILSFAAKYDWVGSWGTPAVEGGLEIMNYKDVIPMRSTIRTVITPTLGGTQLRLKFTNQYGDKAITIDETTVAYTGATNDIIDVSSIKQVTFNGGKKSVKIAPGTEVYSDDINFNVTALKKISISSYFASTTTMTTTGLSGGTCYLASSLGNKTHSANISTVATRLDFTSGAITYNTIPFLTRLDVLAADAYSVAIIGDSTVTNNIYRNLAEKCVENGITNVGFIMSGIVGNALLRDGEGLLGRAYGVPVLERFKRDALNIPGCKYIIVKIGENDILHSMLDSMQGVLPECKASHVIAGYKKLAEQFKNTDKKVYLCTKTPFKGYTRDFLGGPDLTWTQTGENKLLDINKWIVNEAVNFGYTGYINFDKIRSPQDSAKLYDHMTEDGVHFNEYGQMAVTDLIPEAAYGVDHELKDYADIKGVNPYVPPKGEAPTKKPETTTKAPETTTKAPETTTKAPETTTAQNNVIVNPGSNETPTFNTGNLIISTPENTTSANQVLIGDDFNDDQVDNVVDSQAKNSMQLAGFIILAVVAVALISVAMIMLSKHYIPVKRATLGRASYSGRARQKKRV